MKVYYRNSNKNIFTVDIKPDKTMKEVAAKIQDKGGLIPCHVSVTKVNNVCDCGKRIEHLLLESLDNPIYEWLEKRTETIIENQFKESCHETSRHKQNNDYVIALLKVEIEYLKGKLEGKNKVISNYIGFCKTSSGSQDTHHHGYRSIQVAKT